MSQAQQGNAPGFEDNKKIFVGGVGAIENIDEIRKYFAKFGEILSCDMKMDMYTGQSRGFGFIKFSDVSSVDQALNKPDGHFIEGKKIDVKRVTKKANPQKCKIFVGGLTQEHSEEDIKNFFSQYGNIIEFQQPYDKIKQQRKGFCFITYDDYESMNAALALSKQSLNGKEIDVKKVKFNPDPMARQGSAYGSRGAGYMSGAYGYGPYGYGAGYGMYEGFSPYAYDYSGYEDMGYAPQPYAGGKYSKDTSYQRPAPY